MFIETYKGNKFYFSPNDLEKNIIDIEEIAHSLSMQCRFTGHVKRFYSVAEHSVYVSLLVPPEVALHGLLHDAGEAYISDIVTPLKKMKGMNIFSTIENKIMKQVYKKFNLRDNIVAHREVDKADKIMLHTEALCLLNSKLSWVKELPPPCDIKIKNWYPEIAKDQFLRRFDELTKGIIYD